MGAVLSSFLNPELPSDIVIDFDKIESPTERNELEIYTTGQALIAEAEALFLIIESYSGCEALTRQAMAQPSNEALQVQMFEGMFPNVSKIVDFYKLGKLMQEFVVRTVKQLATTGSTQGGVLKTLAMVFNLGLKLDRAKMMHPSIQNDFSQYRRALSKNSRHPGLPAVESEANSVSMFLAQSSPVVALFCQGLQPDAAVNGRFLATFAHICCAFVMREKQPGRHAVFALTAMTVCFLLYDNIVPNGVFAKNSQIDVKSCVQQLGKLKDAGNKQILCDTLHFSTRSFDKAPDTVRRVLEA